jgi:hypothetical protein
VMTFFELNAIGNMQRPRESSSVWVRKRKRSIRVYVAQVQVAVTSFKKELTWLFSLSIP